MNRLAIVTLALVVLTAGCKDGNDGTDPDTGEDAEVDTASDLATDPDPDTVEDTGPEAVEDTEGDPDADAVLDPVEDPSEIDSPPDLVTEEAECLGDDDCDDAVYCNGPETCVEGVCTAGTEPDCDDGDDCTVDMCDETAGECIHDPIDGDGDGHVADFCGGDDCDDGHYTVRPGAPEVCLDGVDQDCDTLVDGPLFTTSDGRISDPGGDASMPSLVWTGSELAVAWDDPRWGDDQIVFARVDLAGARIGSEVQLTTAAGNSRWPAMAWSGSTFGVAWYDDRDGDTEIFFALLDAAGAVLVSEVRITDTTASSWDPDVAWTGSEFAIAWSDYRNPSSEIYLTRISEAGVELTSDIRLTDATGASAGADLAWTGSELALAWQDLRDGNLEMYFMKLDPTGAKIVSDTRITSDSVGNQLASLDGPGSHFALTWHDRREGNDEIYLAILDGDGAVTTPDVRLTSTAPHSQNVDVAWTGSEYVVAWNDAVISLTRVSDSGAVLGSMVTLGGSTSSQLPALAWTGSEMALAWVDGRDADDAIYVNVLGFCD